MGQQGCGWQLDSNQNRRMDSTAEAAAEELADVLILALDDLWAHLDRATKRNLRLVSIRIRWRSDQLVTQLEVPSAGGGKKATAKLLSKAGALWPRTDTLVLKGLNPKQSAEQLALVARRIAGDTFPRLRALEATLVSKEHVW